MTVQPSISLTTLTEIDRLRGIATENARGSARAMIYAAAAQLREDELDLAFVLMDKLDGVENDPFEDANAGR